MMPVETSQAIAQRHVAAGRAIVARQRNLIERIRALGLDTGEAESLLRQFEATLLVFEEDLAYLAGDNGR
jgi:hypothetical protein